MTYPTKEVQVSIEEIRLTFTFRGNSVGQAGKDAGQDRVIFHKNFRKNTETSGTSVP
jgi:hypothetical protein